MDELPEGAVGIEDGKPYGADGRFIYPKTKDLPKTHFRTNDEWILIRDAGPDNLPKIGQQILYVYDIRGLQEESTLQIMHRIGFLSKMQPDQEVKVGYVSDVGFDENFEEWYIVVSKYSLTSALYGRDQTYSGITYWRPLPAPPVDTFVRSPYHHLEIFNIVMQDDIEREKCNDPEHA